MGKQKAGTVRIIGGRWRGRRLPVPDLPGLRPSGDRCRETLFNWLQMQVRGARCADLFAGTGALGFEAASRGAEEVVLVERAKPAARALRDSLGLLQTDSAAATVRVEQGDALAWIAARPPRSLDIVFVDPPFDSGLEAAVLQALDTANCLAEGAVVYLESARSARPVDLSAGWIAIKEKTLGDVRMQLLQKI